MILLTPSGSLILNLVRDLIHLFPAWRSVRLDQILPGHWPHLCSPSHRNIMCLPPSTQPAPSALATAQNHPTTTHSPITQRWGSSTRRNPSQKSLVRFYRYYAQITLGSKKLFMRVDSRACLQLFGRERAQSRSLRSHLLSTHLLAVPSVVSVHHCITNLVAPWHARPPPLPEGLCCSSPP